jgi:hypothetical protein
MSSVEQSIDVDVSLARAQEGWKAFTEWVLVGNYRLVCDEWSCDRMADHETVSFSFLDAKHSRVTVHFDFDDASAPDPTDKAVRVASRLTQDLMSFRDYMDRHHAKRGKKKSLERKDSIARDDRAGRLRLSPDALIERDNDDLFGSPHFQS